MCVIMCIDKERPSEDMVKNAWDTNSHGGGLAWREDQWNEDGTPMLDDLGVPRQIVKWKKGLDITEMQEAIATLPLPFIAHFRIASSGGRGIALTHPVPIDHMASLALEGETHGKVLFHNGTWPKWQEYTLEAAIKSGVPIPDGDWNDTRAMAWLASIYGTGVLNFINEKAAVFSTTEMKIVWGMGWKEIEGVMCSNDFFVGRGQGWQATTNHHQGGQGYYHGGAYQYRVCKFGNCTRKDVVAGTDFCPMHPNGMLLVHSKTLLPGNTPSDNTPEDDTETVTVSVTPGKTDGTKVNGTALAKVPGGAATPLPFGVLTRAQYETMFRAKQLSKSQWKKIRKALDTLEGTPVTSIRH